MTALIAVMIAVMTNLDEDHKTQMERETACRDFHYHTQPIDPQGSHSLQYEMTANSASCRCSASCMTAMCIMQWLLAEFVECPQKCAEEAENEILEITGFPYLDSTARSRGRLHFCSLFLLVSVRCDEM